jgi:hypothetical protein
MQNQINKLDASGFSLNKLQFLSVLSLYFFTLGTAVLGLSAYLFTEASGISEKNLIDWSGQGMFWSLISLFISIFILFIPIEFFNSYKILNRSFKDLIANIVSVILISLICLVLSQILLSSDNKFLNQYLILARAVSFSGFIAIPLVLFLLHNLGKNIYFLEKYSFSLVLFVWVITSQIFL